MNRQVTLKRKQFSWMPRLPLLRAAMQSCPGILAINWVFQGMRGMQRKELSFRVLMESVMILLLFPLLPGSIPVSERLAIAAAGAHSVNWLINGHLWVCARYCPAYRRDPAALTGFLAKTETQLRSLWWLEEAVCIGSVGDAGRVRSERSDIDLRLIFSPGLVNWLRLNLLMLRLRTLALFLIVPLDLYAYDDVMALDRFRQDEGLLPILNRQGRIAARYASRLGNNT